MDRMRAPTEFGFTTPSYIPPERPRSAWRTLLFGGLLALIPIVGPGISAVYIDRRHIPGSFDFGNAVRTAAIQAVAVVGLLVLLWLIIGLLLGVSIHVNLGLTRR